MKLKEYLEYNNISKKQFAHSIDINFDSINKYINNKRIPSLKILERIYIITNRLVSPIDFAFNDDNNTPVNKNSEDYQKKVKAIQHLLICQEKFNFIKSLKAQLNNQIISLQDIALTLNISPSLVAKKFIGLNSFTAVEQHLIAKLIDTKTNKS